MPPWGSASAAGAAGGERAGPVAGRGLSHRPAAPRAQGKRGKGRPGCRSSTLGLRRLFGPTVVRRGTNTAEKQLSPALESPLPRRAPSRGRGAEARARRSLRPSVRPSLGRIREGPAPPSPDTQPLRPGPPAPQPGPLAQRAPRRRLPTPAAAHLGGHGAAGAGCAAALPSSLSPCLSPCCGCSLARSVGVSGPPAAAAGPRRRLLLSVPGRRRRLLGAAVQLSSRAPALGRRGLMWPRCPRLGRPFRRFASAPGGSRGLLARSLSVRARGREAPLRCGDPPGSRPGAMGADGRTSPTPRALKGFAL